MGQLAKFTLLAMKYGAETTDDTRLEAEIA